MNDNNEKQPLILDIKGNSLDDGPGIRSVVFFKGCPLSCVWCHNPESKNAYPEISFDPVKCIDCGSCRESCAEKALSKNNSFYIDRKACSLCFRCLDSCPSSALERVGRQMSIDSIFSEILPDKPFFDASNGGVTLSGGEATLYMDFVSHLLKKFKDNGIHTLIETCGFFDKKRFMELIYPFVDTIFFDVKIKDSSLHKKFCGLPNEKIIENFKALAESVKKDGKTFIPRTPLIPGITDTDENISSIASFYKETGIGEAALLSYNPFWHEKNRKMGFENPFSGIPVMTSFQDRASLERCRSIFKNKEIRIYE